MITRIASTLACAITLSAVALGGATTARADAAEDWFLYQLYRTHQKWYWPFGEDYILGVARGVCHDWSVGVGYDQGVESIAATRKWTHRNSRYFIALATRAFCPQYYTSAIPAEGRIVDLPGP
ncbi:DUF732 domain-containing protein [Mycobacterium sp. NAZ190054]|uniref:DUF732 domain-containing protein n=1 Tax=Mycobacterium sp. NAZ190054 TaxID=1747766 RepID=UPI000794AADA|nr:DUF732 domain-containing protein [Mycobacterium sp. NAZ190054]KWX69240.1 hypothetical protein ASJ79_00105 [Mycobacterium sp. NAZ190054]